MSVTFFLGAGLRVLIGEREEGELPLDKTQEIESLLLTKKDMINKQLGEL